MHHQGPRHDLTVSCTCCMCCAGQQASRRNSQAAHRRSGSSSTSPRAGGLTTAQALAADQMQLLDLVEVLITDHRTSVLERRRLQQQLDSTQLALQAERLGRERAAALADVRWAKRMSRATHSCISASRELQQLVVCCSRLAPSVSGMSLCTGVCA